MAHPPIERVLSHIHRLASRRGEDLVTDGTLLRRFAEDHDESAFAQLVERHADLVWGVCQRVLGASADAEDAFQATLLVLARKAAAIAKRDSLRSWLHGVAFRVARNVRRAVAVRSQRERRATSRESAEGTEELSWREVRQVLDEELLCLPEKYRLPLLLCYLEGKTQDEAARQLGWEPGTFRGRLDRGRERLRRRLVRRGIGLGSALTATLAVQCVAKAAPARLTADTVRAASLNAAGQAAAVSAPVAALAEGVLRSLFLAKVRLAVALFISFAVIAAGFGWAAQQEYAVNRSEAEQAADPPAPTPQPKPQTPKIRLDLYGDALPPGATARLGTVRGGHRGGINCLAFTPDNKALLSFGGDSTLRMWDPATGKEIRRFHQPLLFFPNAVIAANARTAAFIDSRTVHLWDLAAGKEFRRLSLPYFGFHMALTPDGKTLASGDHNSVIHLWDTASGKEIRQLRGHKEFIDALAFSPDGKTLASGSRDRTVRLWDVAAGREIQRLDGHELVDARNGPSVYAVCFAPGGRALASADQKSVRLWDVAGGKEIRRFDTDKERSTAHLTFAPDGKVLAAGDRKTVRLWDSVTGKEIRRVECPEKDGGSGAMAFSSDGKTLALAWGYSELGLFDVETGKKSRQLNGRKLGWIEAVAFAPDSKTLVSGGQGNHAIRLWDAATGKEIQRLEGHESQVDSLAFLPDGKTLASAGFDMTIRLWDLAARREIRRSKWEINRVLSKTAFSPDGKQMISGIADGTLRIWDVISGKEIRRFPVPQSLRTAALSPDGRTLAQVDFETARLVDVGTGKVAHHLSLAYANLGTSAAFSPDGRTLAVGYGSQDHQKGAVHLWEVATGKEIHRLHELRGALYAVAFSPDGRMFATAGFGETIRLWETVTGKEIRRFEGHEGKILSLTFAPNGTSLASVSEDATILLWDVQRFGRPRQTRSLADKDLREMWTTLAGADAAQAYTAIANMADAPGQAVPFLREHLRPLPAIPAKRLAQLLTDLDSPMFAARQKAAEELEKVGPAAEAALRKALAGKPTLEARQRLEQLLVRATVLAPDRLRELRAIQALEQVATPDAKQLLATLADKPGYTQRTRDDAQGALNRMAKRAAVP